jgi:hypothetical protein
MRRSSVKTPSRSSGRRRKSGQDSQLKQFAVQTLPTLEQHLKMAQKTGTK